MNSNHVLLPLIADEIPPGAWLALRQEGIACIPVRQAQAAGTRARFLLYDAQSSGHEPAHRARQLGQIALDLNDLRPGWPFDPFDALIDQRSRRVGWDVGPGLVSEEAAYYPKAEIRRALIDRLRESVESHGGVWLRLSPFPYPYRSAFNFRIDHDDYDADDFDAVLRQLEGAEHAVSHYVCASGFQEHAPALRRLKGFDVGSHGWWHHSYRDPQANRDNIRRGIQALDHAGLTPSGYVAPHGRWTPALAGTLEELGVGHSSEFALDHDDLPFQPFLRHSSTASLRRPRGRFSHVLQLPLHPVCLGLFLEAGLDDESAILDYFARVIRCKHEQGQPIFLYGHPTGRLGRRPAVLQRVFATASQLSNLWWTNLTQFARWWRQRAQISLSVTAAHGALRIHMAAPPSPWAPGLEICRDRRVALVAAPAPSFDLRLDALTYETRPAAAWPARIPLPAAAGWKHHLRRWLDWELITPPDEISIDSVPGIAKRGLRRLRDAQRRRGAGLLTIGES